jgi:uncharacterized membrane protein YkgB
MRIEKMDNALLAFCRKISLPLARFGLFLIYFWFGFLKVIDASPASPLVKELFDKTLGIMEFSTFLVLFGLFEMLIGILFMIKGAERIVMPLLIIHMLMTVMPLFLLPAVTWSGFLVPTMEGQYIIKNIALIGLAIVIATHIEPMKQRGSKA